MNERQFETKLTSAIMMFAVSFQSIMENSSEVLAEKLAVNAENNPEMSVDEMTKEICRHVVSEISREHGI